jgi:nicotinamide-nucleotide amidase
MHGEIIATGTELVTGQTADENARYAARRLHEASLPITCITVVGDDAFLLRKALAQSIQRSQFVLITGGLGATEDDLTVAAAAAELNLKLVEDQDTVQRIRRVWLFFLPGVPHEMRDLFDTVVLPTLLSLAGTRDAMVQRRLRLFGITEAELQNVVSGLGESVRGVDFGFYPNFPETHLTLTLRGEDRQALNEILDRVTAALSQKVGEILLGPEEGSLEELVGLRLKETRFSLAVAESCTGGLICHRITNVSGASDYFLGGVVTYSNQAKTDLLTVSEEVLASRGAVSAETALAMAVGVRELFHADIGLSMTGIAGPTGGTPEKPVGTVYIGLAMPHRVHTRHHLFHGSREQIKTLAAQTALNWLRLELHHAQSLSRH